MELCSSPALFGKPIYRRSVVDNLTLPYLSQGFRGNGGFHMTPTEILHFTAVLMGSGWAIDLVPILWQCPKEITRPQGGMDTSFQFLQRPLCLKYNQKSCRVTQTWVDYMAWTMDISVPTNIQGKSRTPWNLFITLNPWCNLSDRERASGMINELPSSTMGRGIVRHWVNLKKGKNCYVSHKDI